MKGNRADGVEMSNGTRFHSDNIVSNAGLMTTINSLIPEAVVNNLGLKSHLKRVKRSVAHASLYIGLEGTPEELGLPKTNFWIYPGDEIMIPVWKDI